jgi:ribosome-associated protein
MRFLTVNARLKIPVEELQIRYARSSGPGGQNVNKVSSKVTIRWSIRHSPGLSDDLRALLVERFRRRLTVSGDLLVSGQRFRDASRNLADCLEKLRSLLADAVRPRKVRKPTRPTKGSVTRRLDEKRLRGKKKDARRDERWL